MQETSTTRTVPSIGAWLEIYVDPITGETDIRFSDQSELYGPVPLPELTRLVAFDPVSVGLAVESGYSYQITMAPGAPQEAWARQHWRAVHENGREILFVPAHCVEAVRVHVSPAEQAILAKLADKRWTPSPEIRSNRREGRKSLSTLRDGVQLASRRKSGAHAEHRLLGRIVVNPTMAQLRNTKHITQLLPSPDIAEAIEVGRENRRHQNRIERITGKADRRHNLEIDA